MPNLFYIVNVEAAIYKEDQWLIIKRSEREEHAPGTLSFVGGKVENAFNEPDVLEKALKREILEEVGVEIFDEIHYIESKAFVTSDGMPVVDIVFLCRYKCGEPKCASEEEVDAVFWMTASEIINNDKAPWYLKSSIEKAEEKKGKL